MQMTPKDTETQSIPEDDELNQELQILNPPSFPNIDHDHHDDMFNIPEEDDIQGVDHHETEEFDQNDSAGKEVSIDLSEQDLDINADLCEQVNDHEKVNNRVKKIKKESLSDSSDSSSPNTKSLINSQHEDNEDISPAAQSSKIEIYQGQPKPEMDFEAFILEDFIYGLLTGMKLKKLSFDFYHYLNNLDYNFNTEKQCEMQNNIKEKDSDKLHMALGHLINIYDELVKLIDIPENPEEDQFSKIKLILNTVIDKIKKRPIIIDMRENSIEIDNIEVWHIVFKFIELKERQWYKNGKALGYFAWQLSKDKLKKYSSDEDSINTNKQSYNNENDEVQDDKGINIDGKAEDKEDKYEQNCTPQ